MTILGAISALNARSDSYAIERAWHIRPSALLAMSAMSPVLRCRPWHALLATSAGKGQRQPIGIQRAPSSLYRARTPFTALVVSQTILQMKKTIGRRSHVLWASFVRRHLHLHLALAVVRRASSVPGGHLTHFQLLLGTSAAAREIQSPCLALLERGLSSTHTMAPMTASFAQVDIHARQRAQLSHDHARQAHTGSITTPFLVNCVLKALGILSMPTLWSNSACPVQRGVSAR